MPELHQRSPAGATTPSAPQPAGPGEPPAPRPVVLATLSVRIDPSAERMAIESALHARSRLIIANMLTMPPYPATLMLARQYATLPHEEDLEAIRATAQRAAARGVATELLRISSRRPLAALVELVRERRAGLIVLGPDVKRISRLELWWASHRVRRQVDCLVWIAPDG